MEPPKLVTTEPDEQGGWGFINAESSVWRGFQRWMATGQKPRRDEIEDEELAWSNDLDLMMELYQHRKYLKENPE